MKKRLLLGLITINIPLLWAADTNENTFKLLKDQFALLLSRKEKDRLLRNETAFYHSTGYNKQLINKPKLIYVKDENSSRQVESISTILGMGEYKRAVAISDGRALLVPHRCNRVIWNRVVEQEVKMSDAVNSFDLLCSRLKKVKIYPDNKATSFIFAYMTNSFDILANHGIFIIDRKNSESSTWNKRLFASKDDAKKPENWKPFVNLLIRDIAKLVYYKIPTSGDSLNIAIVQTPGNKYKIRYFGFDYAIELNEIKIPGNQKKQYKLNTQKAYLLQQVSTPLRYILAEVLRYEFGCVAYGSIAIDPIVEALKEHYSIDIVNHIIALQKDHS